jgi:prolyl oligopeptidase
LAQNRRTGFFYKKAAAEAPVVELLNDYDARYEFIDNDGPVFYFRTDLNAPCYQVIAIDTRKPQRGNWRIVVPEVPKVLLEEVNTVGGQMFCQYLRDAKTEAKGYDLSGKLLRDVTLPGIGSAGRFGGHRTDMNTFYSFTSFTEPGEIYRMDLKTGESTLWRRLDVKFDGLAYETKQVFYKSKDGTQVPIFIVNQKGLSRDGATRRCFTATVASTSTWCPPFPSRVLCGWRWAAFSPCRICAAAANTVASGTRPASNSASRTCLMTSSPPPSG